MKNVLIKLNLVITGMKLIYRLNTKTQFQKIIKLLINDSNKCLLVDYDNIIKNQFNKGVIEKVTSPPLVGNTTYLPHRPVISEDKATTKVRIVYDASAKNKGPSLNESLYKGPCLTPLLFDVLLRFRAHDIALTADIEKAYLQISVTESERDHLRFLWFDNIKKILTL